MNHMQKSEPVLASDWRQRRLTRVAVFFLAWWHVASYAVDFPSLPLQTGAVQPAPNVVFILDDSLSMTSAGGNDLDTGLSWCANTSGQCPNSPTGSNFEDSGPGAPYTRNALSYNPATTYRPWAGANDANTDVVRLDPADYSETTDNLQLPTGSFSERRDLGGENQTFFVPKPAANRTDRRQYYRYQILAGGKRIVRAEWSNAAPPALSLTTANTFTGITGSELYWGNTSNPTSGGNSTCAGTNFRYQVPGDGSVKTVVITTSGATGTNDNPDLYVRSGQNPCTNNYHYRANTSSADETLTIDSPSTGYLYIGVYNSASGTGDRTFSNLTLTVRYSTQYAQAAMNCSTSASGTWGWKNCVDVSNGDPDTGVRSIEEEKLNYANWYQYHRTRMKAAKAGGSEAFATLDENYRVGITGLYPSGTYQQVIGGATNVAAPSGDSAGNFNNVIPVTNNGGLFVGSNRKNWFDHLHGMVGKQYTPLRKALDAAGRYFSTPRAYQAIDDNNVTTYLACRQNFAILTTDGYWNNWSGSDDSDNNYSGNKISGDEEDGVTITGPNNQTYKYERAAPFWYNINGSDKDDATTLADIAMHYWKTDLRKTDVSGHAGSADNRVPFSVSNPAFWQHMVTFGVGLGVRGKLTDAQVAHAVAGTGTLANGGFWPAPVHATNANENPENVDDLRHAAVNSRGSYVNANDAQEFSQGIADALNRIGERKGSASNVLANSTSISTESFVYQATYTAGAWRGELLAYPISGAGLGAPEWRAGEHIAAWGSRKVFTYGASSGAAFPTATQTSSLGTAASTLGLGVTGDELAQYLKGNNTKEARNGGALRNRVMRSSTDQVVPALLGDIVNSSPFYVADIQTIFVGANDGMLHAFDATNTAANATNTSGGGTERFAYIPRGVAMSQLADLADPLYGTNTATKPHRYFVDGPIVVSARARTPGKNYLVGALGRGGRGVYGLDVSNPASFSDANVLWDYTGSAAPANMGNVIAEPLISKLNNGSTAAIVANGPNSASGTASLFILSLADGSVIKEIDTSTTGGNGLSAPRSVDINADGVVDYFFAGDLLGNLWRFDVSASDTASWSFGKVFTARDASNNPQPITSAPGVARDPSTGKVWVFFGTGRYMTADDQASTAVQTYYGIVVGQNGSEGSNLLRADLQQRTIYVVDATTGQRAFEPAQTAIGAGKQGWYVDLNNPSGKGERVVSSPLIYDNILVFSSIVPPGQATVNSCDAGGTGYVNALDAFSGTSLAMTFFEYTPGTIKDVNGNDLPIGSVPIGSGMPTAPIIIGDKLVIGDSSGGVPTTIDVSPPGGSSTRRVSWRELLIRED
ncbi:MAG TPA: PilC/PilY family type IV pilus protein [Steroidobacteraceae bacterium]|nr:PilC/PilY family type IV pilus protein [Steroidobacteraceae bacterium]